MFIKTQGLGSRRNGGPRTNGKKKFYNKFSGRPSTPAKHFGGNRPNGQSARAGKFAQQSFSDISKFVNKSSTVVQEEAYNPTNNFMDFDVVDILKTNIKNKGYKVPSPIQDQAIPPILEGRDVIGLASTGTGKTAAFLVPIINKIYKDNSNRALIIAPTRELAQQIDDELYTLTFGMQIRSALVIGGASMNRQIESVSRKPAFVIATPGRLKDLLLRGQINLEDYKTFVLDEVDRMVDIGFIKDIEFFIELLPKVRQSLFFSATISPSVQTILNSFVQNPITIAVKKRETSENVDQDVVMVNNQSQKIEKLHDLLITDGFDKVLIFGRTKHGIEKLNRELIHRGFKAESIHGNKSQGQRQKALDNFKNNRVQILLATDVASRGLDIDNVTHVINYDLPPTYEDYIHRIGRTGRADKKGSALTFVNR